MKLWCILLKRPHTFHNSPPPSVRLMRASSAPGLKITENLWTPTQRRGYATASADHAERPAPRTAGNVKVAAVSWHITNHGWKSGNINQLRFHLTGQKLLAFLLAISRMFPGPAHGFFLPPCFAWTGDPVPNILSYRHLLAFLMNK